MGRRQHARQQPFFDYGSIRQFAAKHDKYRFKDVDRYSASLAEQRGWARTLVQVFAQTMDSSRPAKRRTEHIQKRRVPAFDRAFAMERDQRMLWRIGFTPEQISYLMNNAQKQIRFRSCLSYLRTEKSRRASRSFPTASTHSPVFLIRNCCEHCLATTCRGDDPR